MECSGQHELVPVDVDREHIDRAEYADNLYRGLSNSPFPSLYAAENWAEDFAECFTWYFFTTRLGQPYRVGIRRGGTVEVEYEPIYWSRVVHRFPQLDHVVQDARK